MAYKLARGRCPYCGRTKALTKNGKIRKHNQRGKNLLCGGSGQRPT
jgi:transposase-like protein